MADDSDLGRRFARLAVPNTLANLMVPLAGLVDTAMLGHFGAVRDLGGVALGTLVFDYLFWSFGFLRMGTTGLTAQAFGAGDTQEQSRILGRGLLLAAGIGSAALVLQAPLEALSFGLLEGAESVKESGRAYYGARIWGAPAALTNFVLHGFLLGRQRGRKVLLLSITVNGINVALDYLFIARWGWGAAGAGYATFASQLGVLVLGVALVAHEMTDAGMRLERGVFEPEGLKAFLRLGGDLLIRTFALLTGFAIFTDFSAVMGADRLASNTLLQKAVTLCAFFVDGYAFAVESMAGALHGAGKPQGMRRLLTLAMGVGVATGALFAAAFALMPGTLFGLLTDHGHLVQMASDDRLWLLPMLTLGSMAWILDGYFLGLAQGRILSRSQVAVVLFFVPWALWARSENDPQLLWLAFTIFTGSRVVSLGYFVPRTLSAGFSRSQISS